MVSIIIPVYNAEKYLAECVESVRAQTLSDIEIILVDDGSTDHSPALCDGYGKRDERIQVIHQKNGGSTKARNTGLRAAHGDYIGFVDSDDWIEPEMYEELLEYMLKNKADIAAGVKYCHHETSMYREKPGIPEGIYEKGDSEKTLIRNLIFSEDHSSRGISPNLCDKLFKKELLCKFQFGVNEKTKYGEDDVCVYSCLLHADRVVMVDKAYYHYRQREGSICHSTDDMYFEEITYFYQQLKEQFLQHPDADILMGQLKRYMLEFVIRGINRHFGFGYGVVVPYFYPPIERLQPEDIHSIILYGAGNVGQDYYRVLQLLKTVRVVAWIDRQYEDYQKKGFPVRGIGCIEDMEYDAVLIAVANEELAEGIRRELEEKGVPGERIIYETPQNMIRNIGRIGCG